VKRYFALAFISLIIFFSIFHSAELISQNDELIIFVVDSEVEESFLNSPLPKLELSSSHGSRTAAQIRSISSAEIRALSAENFLGNLTKERYLAQLEKIREYKLDNPDKKILVNISLGFSSGDFQREIIEQLSDENLLIIAAAGNNNLEKGSYPAFFEEVLAAAALENGRKMAESNYGEFIDLSAEGVVRVNEYVNLPSNTFSRTISSRGTSFAAPRITGALAEVLSYNKELSIAEGIEILKNSAGAAAGPLYEEGKLGAGSLNTAAALREASPAYSYINLSYYLSIFSALFFMLIGLWKKYSYISIIITAALSILIYLSWPLLLILYYRYSFKLLLTASFLLLLIYISYQRIIYFMICSSCSIWLLISLKRFLNDELKEKAVNKIIVKLNEQESSQAEKDINYLRNKLRQASQAEKAEMLLKIFSRLNKPPIGLIIEKISYLNIEGRKIGLEMKKTERSYKERAVITGDLLYYLIRADYKGKKKTAGITSAFKEALILPAVKNLLIKRNEFIKDNNILYFALDITAVFAKKAQDFSKLLQKIIREDNDPWLKYHALKAYVNIAEKDLEFKNFIKEVMENEDEPVTLAL